MELKRQQKFQGIPGVSFGGPKDCSVVMRDQSTAKLFGGNNDLAQLEAKSPKAVVYLENRMPFWDEGTFPLR